MDDTRIRRRTLFFLILLATCVGRALPGSAELASIRVAASLASPVSAKAPPGDPRLFIVERGGTTRILEGGSLRATPFLDIRSLFESEPESALLDIAFPLDFASTGFFYVYYLTPARRAVVARYTVSEEDRNVASPETGATVIEIQNDTLAHVGGSLQFHPINGLLYMGLGDGGGPFNLFERAQDPTVLLGKFLRIDVSDGLPYSIPSDNPHVDDPRVLDEIWSTGFRNPFRWGFDRLTGDLWIGDVGQEAVEEINFESAGDTGGKNYGWDVMEGNRCVTEGTPPALPCFDPSLTPPVFTYPHTDVEGCSGSVTGGLIYRGQELPGLFGQYVFGDFCSRSVTQLDPASLQATDRSAELSPDVDGNEIGPIVAFAEDGSGELHIVDITGNVFRVVGAPPISEVRVASTAWTAPFLSVIDPVEGLGFPMPAGAQPAPLPWSHADRLHLTFAADIGARFDDFSFSLRGVNVSDYAIVNASYDPATQRATLQLGGALDTDKLRLVVTDSVTDLHFSLRFDVMPGDAGRSGATSVSDVGPLRAALGQLAGQPAYSPFADFDGSGAVSVSDVGPLRSHLGEVLPPGEPSAAP
jgi:glucose/arabinose dehydrogenase